MRIHHILSLLAVAIGVGLAGPAPLAAQSKVVERYEFESDYPEPKAAQKRLTAVSFLDQNGRLVEAWDLTNAGDGATHRRYVYAYDRRGRQAAELTYESAKGPAGEYFSTVRTRTSIRILPALPDALVAVSLKRYDAAGRLLETRMSGADGELKELWTHTFDPSGRRVAFRRERGDGTVITDSTIVHQGRYSVQTFRKCDCVTVRIEMTVDEAGRPITAEDWTPSPSDPGRLVRSSRSVSTYKGGARSLDWTLFDSDGEPRYRLLIEDDTRGNEISRREYRPSTENGELVWARAQEEHFDYEYDKAGDIVKEVSRRRDAPGQPFRYSFGERRVTYFDARGRARF